MSKLPTAAELMEAVHEGRLMEVPLPFAQYRTVGDLPTPDDDDLDASAWLNNMTLNGRHFARLDGRGEDRVRRVFRRPRFCAGFLQAAELRTAPPSRVMHRRQAVFGPVESIWPSAGTQGLRTLQNAPVSLPATG